MANHKILTRPKDIRNVFLLCWAAYFLCYIGKLNYSAAMAEMVTSGVLQSGSAGTISMTFFVCYGVGQLVNGILADKLSPRKMITLGLFVAGLCNLAMSFGASPLWFASFWGLNGFAASMIWAPIMCILSRDIPTAAREKYLIQIPSSMALGTLASYGLAALMVALSGWKGVFVAAGGTQLAGAALCGFGLTHMDRRRLADGAEPPAPKDGQSALQPQTATPLLRVLLSSAVLIILLPVVVNGFLKDGATSWIPTFLSETFSITSVVSILITMVIPILNLTGAYAAGFVQKRLKNELATSAVFFATAAAALLALWLAGSQSIAITVACLGITTASMMAANTMFLSFYPIRFTGMGRVGTVTGFLNACAYMGAAVCSGSTGFLQTGMGWQGVFALWLGLTVLAGLACLLFSRRLRRWNSP